MRLIWSVGGCWDTSYRSCVSQWSSILITKFLTLTTTKRALGKLSICLHCLRCLRCISLSIINACIEWWMWICNVLTLISNEFVNFWLFYNVLILLVIIIFVMFSVSLKVLLHGVILIFILFIIAAIEQAHMVKELFSFLFFI